MLQEQQRGACAWAEPPIGVAIVSRGDGLRRGGRGARGLSRIHDYSPFPLAEDDVVQIDGDDQGGRCRMAVRLEAEDLVLCRKDNARDFLNVRDVVYGSYSSAYFDMVVVALQQSLVIEVKRLLCTMGRDIS